MLKKTKMQKAKVKGKDSLGDLDLDYVNEMSYCQISTYYKKSAETKTSLKQVP